MLREIVAKSNVSVVKSNSTLSMTHGDREQSALCQQINSNEIKRSWDFCIMQL